MAPRRQAVKREHLALQGILLLALLLPVPARFALGIVIFLLYNFIVLGCTLFTPLVIRLDMRGLYQFLMVFFVITLTLIFKQLVIFFSPVIAMILSLPFFVTAFCAFHNGGFSGLESANAPPRGLKARLGVKMRQSLVFSGFALGLSLIRELAAYGSVSFPTPQGMAELPLPMAGQWPTSFFWGSIPGTLVMGAILLALVFFVHNNFVTLRGGSHD
jgi:hypothetical protein